MNNTEYINSDVILTGNNEEENNVIESLIKVFTTPIAKRKGVIFSSADCEVWSEELKNFKNKLNQLK